MILKKGKKILVTSPTNPELEYGQTDRQTGKSNTYPFLNFVWKTIKRMLEIDNNSEKEKKFPVTFQEIMDLIN